MKVRRGFTIIELLIFAAIFSSIMAGLITVLITMTRVQSRQSSATDVETQGQFLLQQFQYYIQTARLVDMVQDAAAGTLKLRELTLAPDPTFVTLATGTVYLQQGLGGALQPLTSNKVTVSNLSFIRHYNLNSSSTAYGVDSASYSFTVSANTSNTTQQYFQKFQSSAAVTAPVPKIALMQQTSTLVYGTSTNMAGTYIGNNATGSLLVAVVVNTNLVSISIGDTAGNAWSNIASTTYAAYNQKITIFAAANVRNSSNTVTATLGGSGGYNPSLFLYEYRSASTSSLVDASSTQTQSNATAISSGPATPTSNVELVFGVMYLNTWPATPPVAGSGFTIKSSSSASNTFIEDKNVYVTGPVVADWALSQAASSSATVVTFK